jgi:hypothetical protein
MEYSRREIRTFFLTFVAIIAGPIMIWNSVGKLYTAMSSKRWPTVEGEIFDAQVLMSSGRRSRSYQPHITFGYKVNGQDYTSTQLTHGDPESYSDQFKAATAAREYVPGAPVTVYYHPKDPKQAVLQTGATGSNWLFLIMGIAVTGFGVFTGRGYLSSLQATTLKPRSGSGF